MVVDVGDAPLIDAHVLQNLYIPPHVERVLFKTRNTVNRLMFKTPFDTSYVALDDSGARYIVERTKIKVRHLSSVSHHVCVYVCLCAHLFSTQSCVNFCPSCCWLTSFALAYVVLPFSFSFSFSSSLSLSEACWDRLPLDCGLLTSQVCTPCSSRPWYYRRRRTRSHSDRGSGGVRPRMFTASYP